MRHTLQGTAPSVGGCGWSKQAGGAPKRLPLSGALLSASAGSRPAAKSGTAALLQVASLESAPAAQHKAGGGGWA